MARGKCEAKVHAKVEVPPHLRLGLNFAAYSKFVENELCKVGFNRPIKHFRRQYPESLFWIAVGRSPSRWGGYPLPPYPSTRVQAQHLSPTPLPPGLEQL